MWTRYSSGRITAAEGDLEVRPSFASTAKRPVIFFHGAAEWGDGWMGVPTRWPVMRAPSDAGLIMVAADLGGRTAGTNNGAQTWGNDTAQSRITAVYNAVQSTPGVTTGKALLMAQSMGFLNAIIWAKNNPDKVAAVVGFFGVINLTDVHATPGGYDTLINTAYGEAYTEAKFGATRNPLTMARNGAIPAIPIQFWYGLDDLLCKPQFAREFVALTGAEGKPIDGGHTEAAVSNIDPAQISSFLLRHA